MREPAAASAASDINSRIASRVRSLRTGRGMSLDALAAKTGVSRSMLSLIERGESSPTAVVLDKIATGLDVALAGLFDDGRAVADPVSRRADRTEWRDPETGYVRCSVSPPNVSSPIRIVEVTLPAGAKAEYESGDGSIHQQVWVQEGSIEVTLGNVAYPLSEGDCLAMQLDEPTTFRNRTPKAARYVVVVASDRRRASRS